MYFEAFNSVPIQAVLFLLLAFALLVCVLSLFIRPAKRTIRASLVDGETGHILDISRAETSIGRSSTCDIALPDPSVSRFHAVLSMRSKSWMIFDTNSTAGVEVNGQKIDKKADLHDGDLVRFGNVEFIFYSTAVTTQQTVVPRTRQPDAGARPQYRRKYTTQRQRAQQQPGQQMPTQPQQQYRQPPAQQQYRQPPNQQTVGRTYRQRTPDEIRRSKRP